MNATTTLHLAGQSLWLDHITRELLDSGTLERYIAELSVTGLTSNPTIYEKAIGGSDAYDEPMREGLEAGSEGEDLFFELALGDLRRAADAFGAVHARTGGTDGWVSLEVSPLLVRDAAATVEQAVSLHHMADRPNLYIKIPGTPEGLPAIEDAIFAGVPVNVTLLFTSDHYLAAAEAYLRGLERRLEAGLDALVSSVASLFVSRWDVAVKGQEPAGLESRLGVAIGANAYADYRALLETDRWQRLANAGARPQRLLFASTGTKDPDASDVLYVAGLAAPNTVDTMPEATLLALADHGEVGALLAPDGGDSRAVLDAFAAAGVDLQALGKRLQDDGADSFAKSWRGLMELLEAKSRELVATR
jgi:transaldolase